MCSGNNDLFLFCGKGDKEYFQRVLKHPRLTLIELPTRNLNAQTYSDLLMTEEFWARFKNYTHALTIQSDGCLCKESAYLLEDFLHYDYVGGYAEQGWWVNQGFFDEKTALDLKSAYQCFNGGFSLRNVNATLEVIKKFPPRMSKSWANKPKFHIHYPEDLYFVLGMILLIRMWVLILMPQNSVRTETLLKIHFVSTTLQSLQMKRNSIVRLRTALNINNLSLRK